MIEKKKQPNLEGFKRRTMWAKPNSQGVKNYIDDCFLMFWFRLSMEDMQCFANKTISSQHKQINKMVKLKANVKKVVEIFVQSDIKY